MRFSKMMYNPDRWIVISTGTGSEKHERVLSGWYGGYLDATRWKLSSGTVEVIDNGAFWEMTQHSGAVYNCYKNSYGLTALTSQILERLLETNEDIDIVEKYAKA
jgi:hypothetical protein